MIGKHGMTKLLGYLVVVVCTLILSGCIEGESDTQGSPDSVTQVDTGLGLTGGPITTTGTINLKLSTAGGLVKTWGLVSDELGIRPGFVDGDILSWNDSATQWELTQQVPDALTLGGQTSADLDAKYVEVAGDTMTGLLTLSGDPTANLHATSKQYVDTANTAQDAIIATSWQTGGNAGLIDGTDNILGTTDNVALEFLVNNARALRIEPTAAADAPNIIGGHSANSVTAGVVGATISGGGFNDGIDLWENRVFDDYGTICGGFNNTASGWYDTVGGGDSNTASGDSSTVGGGWQNTASGLYSTVGGGRLNTAIWGYATVGGGDDNTASADSATVGGGWDNTASGPRSTVVGGEFNTASGWGATVGGGYNNTASGSSATVPGGDMNIAAGSYSFAAGYAANVLVAHSGTFLWADNQFGLDFDSVAANEFAARATGGVRFVTKIDGAGSPTQTTQINLADGTWQVISDRNRKKNFQELDCGDVLGKIARMPVTMWNYKWESDDAIPHIGPVAQDFKALFYPGRDDKTISTLEFDGVELAAIKALEQRTAQLKLENAALKKALKLENAELKAALKEENAALKTRIAKLEAALLSAD